MKFLNLNTGYSFDGLWTEDQSKGYIFWFPKEQSIGLTYTMPIAVITDNNKSLSLKIEDNDIFSFISIKENIKDSQSNNIDIDGYSFDGKPIYSNTMFTKPEKISKKLSNNTYVHVFNIACKSENAGEYVCKINIGNDGYIRVGADFYGEHEPIYINLANMGVELPTSIQKAIYDSNVHEDITDNILINRKFKELMSNYWNIIANKGSYKSLLNAFEWFEWEDQIKLKEIYRHNEASKIIFNDKDMISSLENTVEENFNNFIKTTYVSLYCALQDELPSFDNEYNPQLVEATFKWAKNDIKLKIALFAKFFGLYFLPIHMSILHATAEDKVFTNTIKVLHGSKIKRTDNFYDYEYVESNITDNSIFKLTNVRAQVTDDTVFGVKYPNNKVFGVDEFLSNGTVTAEDISIKTFSQQYYTGPGAIIPITLIIPNRTYPDFIKKTLIEYIDDNNELINLEFNNIFNTANNKITINFNFLAKSARDYNIKFTFILGSSKTITRNINFTVEDVDNLNINVYKIRSKNNTNGFTLTDFYDEQCSKYLFRIQPYISLEKSYYMQYLPYMEPIDSNYNNYKGIKLNHTIVIDIKSVSNTEDNYEKIDELINYISNLGYLYFIKYEYNETSKSLTDTKTYITFIANKFRTKFFEETELNVLNYISEFIKDNFNNLIKVIRNDAVFYPQFHQLERIEGNRIENYTISPYESVCCAAEINNGNEIIDFRYGHMITGAEWTFYNHLTNETINHPASSQVPFVAGTRELLKPGYYDISFRYSLNNGTTNEVKLDSAFRIK